LTIPFPCPAAVSTSRTPQTISRSSPSEVEPLFYIARNIDHHSPHSVLKSSGTSPNFLTTLASLKSPVSGSPVRLYATAPTWPTPDAVAEYAPYVWSAAFAQLPQSHSNWIPGTAPRPYRFNVQSTASGRELSDKQTIDRAKYSEVGSMSDHVSRKQLKRIVVGAISLLILTCVATFAAARYFVA
jgi:hypothetical protein